MAQPTGELEALIGTIIYNDCKVDGIINILQEKGIIVSSEEIEKKLRFLPKGIQYEKTANFRWDGVIAFNTVCFIFSICLGERVSSLNSFDCV